MDNKELLALIGKLYLDVNQLTAYAEGLRNRVAELENQIATMVAANSKSEKNSK